MAGPEFDMRQQRETYDSVLKLTGYTIFAILIIVLGLTFGVVAKMGWSAIVAMFIALVALTIVAAVRR
jgi:hypothetical protein